MPPGRYLTGTVRLRSGINLVLEAGAVLVGTPDLDQYESYRASREPAGPAESVVPGTGAGRRC